ncbi:TMEM175 family protein [Enterococcus sp. LJL128]
MSKTRIEAFTDAVIAIIMTILVLELLPPDSDTWAALYQIGHKIFIYIISFIMLAIYWNNHHHMFQMVHRISGRVLWANNFFIFSLTLMPFATAWVGDYLDSLVPELVYGLVVLLADFAYFILMRELMKADEKNKKLRDALNRYYKMYISLGLNVTGLVLGWLIHPYLVLIVNIGILIMWFIPEKRIEQQYKEQ